MKLYTSRRDVCKLVVAVRRLERTSTMRRIYSIRLKGSLEFNKCQHRFLDYLQGEAEDDDFFLLWDNYLEREDEKTRKASSAV